MKNQHVQKMHKFKLKVKEKLEISDEDVKGIDKLIEEQGKPSPMAIHPIANYRNEINVKPTLTNKNIIVGDFMYIADREFESHVTHASLLVGNLVKERETVREDKQYERLKNLKALLEIYITDLCDELSDIIKEKMDVDTREIIRYYFN